METQAKPASSRVRGAGSARRIEIPLLAAIPGLAHAFTTRGAVTDAALRDAAGADLPVRTVRQVHGAEARLYDAADGGDPSPADRRAEGDAVIVTGVGVAAGVFVADCLPILVCDEIGRAVAAVHAGWRGTVAGALRYAIEALVRRTGSSAASLRLGFGPAIGPCCFEVGDEVVEALLEANPGAAAAVHRAPGRRPHVDLAAVNRRQAMESGVREEGIESAGLCTRCLPELFPSYRRDGPSAGRIAALIAWRVAS